MAGCDGRDSRRVYYEEVARKLPPDTLILTAGCAKYAFYKLPLGNIQGLPRVLDAGQCNDCYSLIHFARQLARHLQVDLNALPISYQVCWYDQKAVAVFLSLLALGVRKIRLGPTLPAYFTPKFVARLQRDYDLAAITDAHTDVQRMSAGE
jgi:hydroxylamine reductase